MEESEYAQQEKEYVIQHFGQDPGTIIQDISEQSVDFLTGSLEAIQQKIKTSKAGKFKEESLESGIKKLERRYTESFEKIFDNLQTYFNNRVFKIPQHVLLKEDSVWDELNPQAAKERLTKLTMEMEKMREEYKSTLYKKTYLRAYLEKLKSVCIHQEEVIQKEVELKEKHGILEGEEAVGLHTRHLSNNLEALKEAKVGLKRTWKEDEGRIVAKKMKLEQGAKLKLEELRRQQIECSQ